MTPITRPIPGHQTPGHSGPSIFDDGKELYTQKCLRCHGCSGNGQGPYARQTVTHPANLNERIQTFPGENYHFWRVSEGVPGTDMPPWGWSAGRDDPLGDYHLREELRARAPSGRSPAMSPTRKAMTSTTRRISCRGIAGTQQDYERGQAIYNLYCAQCHGSRWAR